MSVVAVSLKNKMIIRNNARVSAHHLVTCPLNVQQKTIFEVIRVQKPVILFVSSRKGHTRLRTVTGVQTCALPIYSGDAAMVMPPHTLPAAMLATVRKATYELARELKVVGLMNVQFAIKDHQLY